MAGVRKVDRPAVNVFWLTGIGVNWLVVIATVTLALYLNHLAVYLLAMLVIGTRQHALAVMLHDATHFHVSRNKRFNDLLGNLLIAWPLPFSASGYRRWHFQHHRTVGTDADPELLMYRMFGPKWSPDANRLKLFLTDLIGLGAWELIILWDDLNRWRPESLARRIEEAIGLMLFPLVMASLFYFWLGWRDLLVIALLWYGSIFTTFFAVYRLRCYSEHIGSEWTHRLDKPPLWQRLLYLPANTWLHWEHHTWPAIPLRQMKQANPAHDAPAHTTEPVHARAADAGANG